MKNWLQQRLQNKYIRLLVTALGIGVLIFVISDEFRMALIGTVLALALGGYLLYVALIPRGRQLLRGLEQPDLTRWLLIAFGLFALTLGFFMLNQLLQGNIAPRQQTRKNTIQQRLEQALHSSSLDLYDLKIHEVPPGVWQMTHLRRLNLHTNRLVSLPSDIQNLANLEELDLWNNHLTALPPEIGTLAHLTRLDVSGNRLTSLPSELAQLKALTTLDLEYNRFTEFPNVILELPNLERLYLSGNRMGDLPASITQRAANGELTLSYRPYATRINFFSAFILIVTLVLPVALSLGLENHWRRRERARYKAARQQGRVFLLRPQLRLPALFATFGLGAITLLLFLISLGAKTGIDGGSGLIVLLIFTPVVLGMALFVRYQGGMAVLTAEGITMQRAGRQQHLPYTAITALETRRFALALRVHGNDITLRIPRMVENYPQLYEHLLARVSPKVREATFAQQTAHGVYVLQVTRRMRWLYGAGAVLFVALYLFLGTIPIWSTPDPWPLSPKLLQSALFFFGLISVIFLPATIFVIYSLFTRYGPFKIEQPSAWELTPDRLRYRFPRGGWHERPARELQQITLESYTRRVRGGRGIHQNVMIYMLVFTFNDNTRLVIGQERAAQFGISIEKLHILLRELYKN